MVNQRTWTKEEIMEMWPQAKGELQGFQRHLEIKAGITATQLGMALQLAEAEFKRLKLLPVVAEQNLLLASTKVEPEKIQDLLREKCSRASDSEGSKIDLPSCIEVDKIEDGLERVFFDFENYEYTHDSPIGQFRNLLGPRYFGKIPAVGCAAGGDWEYPVFFIIYLDHDDITLKSYIPKDGNTWNYDTESAFGNDEEADANFLVSWATTNRPNLSLELIKENPTDNAEIMFSEDKIIKDIEDNVRISP
ncbi:MAG: hypothetical protein Q7S43_00905 [bacterium]|nr:hypothetical protein [bacterium]